MSCFIHPVFPHHHHNHHLQIDLLWFSLYKSVHQSLTCTPSFTTKLTLGNESALVSGTEGSRCIWLASIRAKRQMTCAQLCVQKLTKDCLCMFSCLFLEADACACLCVCHYTWGSQARREECVFFFFFLVHNSRHVNNCDLLVGVQCNRNRHL